MAALLVSPAIGGPKFLTLPKAKKVFFTKAQSNARFLTKGQGAARFLDPAEGNAAFLDQGEGDARYLQPGRIRLAVGASGWQPKAGNNAGTLPTWLEERARISIPDGVVDQAMVASPALPVDLFGTTFRLTGMELCYSAPSDLVLDRVQALRVTQTTNALDAPVTAIEDNTPRTDAACRTYSPAAPVPIGPNDSVAISLRVDNPAGAGASSFSVGRTTLILEP